MLPEVWYPRDTQAFQEAADRDLRLSTAFVQLLGPIRGKSLPGPSFSYVAFPHQLGISALKPILQSRDPRLDLRCIEDLDTVHSLKGTPCRRSTWRRSSRRS